MQETSNRCQYCGEVVEPGKTCLRCTVTDMNLSALTALRGTSPEDFDACLVDSRTAKKFPISSTKWKIGRDPTNHLVNTEDTYCSRFHAWINFEDGHYFIEDLGSTNGTLVNGEPLIRRRPLVNRDHIRVGRTDYTFVRGSRTQQKSAEQTGMSQR